MAGQMTDVKEFTCAMCRKTFISGWSEEEAQAECEKLFGNIALEDRRSVCDDCFEKIRPDRLY